MIYRCGLQSLSRVSWSIGLVLLTLWLLGDAYGPRSHPIGPSLLRVLAADAVSIAIAAFAVSTFAASFIMGAAQ